jgi:hypothetical protein
MDLNRVWQDPSPRLHPTICAMKQLLKDFSGQRELALFCDLHGHSCRNDVFMYGCEKKPRDAKPFHSDWPVPGGQAGRPASCCMLELAWGSGAGVCAGPVH